jgi:hypothetical protein
MKERERTEHKQLKAKWKRAKKEGLERKQLGLIGKCLVYF